MNLYIYKDTIIMNIPQEALLALKDELPHGSIKEISKKTKYSQQYSIKVLKGEVNVNLKNMSIIKEAQRIIKRERHNTELLNKNINKMLSE